MGRPCRAGALHEGRITGQDGTLGYVAHGWAWAARMAKDGHKLWAVASWAILTVALGVTLLGGAGSFYRAANTRIAVAESGSDAYGRADAELKRIEEKRKALTKHRTAGEIEPDISASKADKRYKVTDGCTPDQVTKSLEFCRGFRALETELAAAREAERLDQLAAKHLDVVGKGRPNISGGPGDILAAVFGMTQAMGNALFSLLCTVALDFGAVMALVTAELRSPRTSQEQIIVPAPVAEPLAAPEPIIIERPKPKLAVTNRQPVGAVLDFLDEGVEIAAAHTEMAEAYFAYSAWCKATERRAMTVAAFIDAMENACRQFGIRLDANGDKLCVCLAPRIGAGESA